MPLSLSTPLFTQSILPKVTHTQKYKNDNSESWIWSGNFAASALDSTPYFINADQFNALTSSQDKAENMGCPLPLETKADGYNALLLV